MVKKEEKFRVNEKIIAEQVRVIDEEGDMMGVMPPSQAIPLAGDKGLDLVEIAPKATPPTCKIMDYGKWKFKLSKKEKISRKNQVKIIIKEIQLRPRTDVHDLQIKMKKATEFLLNGCKVKVHLRYSGREIAHKELGLQMLDKVKSILLPYSILETDTPQIEKRSVFLFFAPDPMKLKELQKKKKTTSKKQEEETTEEVDKAESKAKPENIMPNNKEVLSASSK
ncbi:MAG: translation initiation factor IF-3 [Bdellovibrionales bacterium]|nr:translation initiation factor IF-3 [Bdellovibrionales bacterium]